MASLSCILQMSNTSCYRAYCFTELVHALCRKSRPVRCKASQEEQAQQQRAESNSADLNGASRHADEASSNGSAPAEVQGYILLCLRLRASICKARATGIGVIVNRVWTVLGVFVQAGYAVAMGGL